MLTILLLMTVKLNLFIPPEKQLYHELKIKLNGKNNLQTYSVKSIEIHLDKYLTWKYQINNVAVKLNKANIILSKIGHYADIKTYQFIMKFLNHMHHIYLVLHWFGCKINDLLKYYIFYRKNQSACYFQNSKTQKS